MMLVIGIVAVLIAVLAGFGVEARGVDMAKGEPVTPLG